MPEENIGDLLLILGITLAFLLGFETLIGTSIRVSSSIQYDSMYVIAFANIAIIYFALRMFSKSNSSDNLRILLHGDHIFVVLLLFIFSCVLAFVPVSTVPWESVYWFEPASNFYLIKAYFQTNLFVALLLVFAVVLIFTQRRADSGPSK